MLSKTLLSLEEMQKAMAFIQRNTEAIEAEEFYEDEVLHTAIAHQLQVVGQAARKLSDEFMAQHAEIPWRQIIGLRNRIVHEYAKLDIRTIWDISQTDVPILQQQIAQLMALLEPSSTVSSSHTSSRHRDDVESS